MYDITDSTSFDHIKTWKDHFLSRSQAENQEKIPFLILGNKCDLEPSRAVQTSNADTYCKENDNMLFFETSAKDAVNVNTAFHELAKQAVEIQEKRMTQMGGRAGGTAERVRGRRGLNQRTRS